FRAPPIRVAGFDEAADTVEAVMPEPRSEERALRSKFMLIFRGGAVARHDLSPSELQAHVQKWDRWSDELARQGWGNVGTALDDPRPPRWPLSSWVTTTRSSWAGSPTRISTRTGATSPATPTSTASAPCPSTSHPGR